MAEARKTAKLYEEIILKTDNSKVYTERIGLIQSKKLCICNNYNELKVFECFKCKAKVHNCVKVQINRPQIHAFECLSCLARSMDLVYQPQVILLETFYKTENIFERANEINFEFELRFEDTKYPVDVRGFRGNKIELAWPMQGQFYLNDGKMPLFSLKPLKSNSNRKQRKEETFMIEPKLLKEGKNTLTFRIPRLNKQIVIDKYKYEETGVYFMGIYSVKELKNQEVLNITQKERRFEKIQTLRLFRQGDEDVPTEKQKVRLIDPYTGERIKFPVRGKYCTHIAAVCLLSYVSFQRHSRSWKCPVCSVQSNSFLNEPYLDIWMHEMLNDNTKGENVFIHPNGTYEWEEMKSVAEVLDSDSDEDVDQKNPEIIVQEEPIITELQNFDLESHNQHSNQPLQVDLIDYDDFVEIQPSQNDIWHNRQEYQSEGEMLDIIDDQIESQARSVNFDARSVAGDPIIEELNERIESESGQSGESSELQFPFNNNDFVPSTKLQNVKIQPAPVEPEKKDPSKTPQIYSVPLKIKPKKTFDKRPQANVPAKSSNPSNIDSKTMMKMNLFKEKILEKAKQKDQSFEQKPLPNQPQKKQVFPQQSKLQSIPKDQFIGDKRMIQRPTFIQTVEQRAREGDIQSLEMMRNQRQLSFGKVQKKKIEWSQERSQERLNRSEPKIQTGLGKIFPLPQAATKVQQQQKSLKKEQPVIQKPKSQKVSQKLSQNIPQQKIKSIRTLTCTPISHSRFVKEYCKIPIPTMFKRMNDDMKKIFGSIL